MNRNNSWHASTLMATRVGIELSPLICRVVEIEAGPAGRSAPGDTRVCSFEVMGLESADARAKLASLRGRRAAVVVWGALNDHRLVTVAGGRHKRMRAAAAAHFAGSVPGVRVDMGRVLAEIAPAGPRVRGKGPRPVMLAVADAGAVREVLRPLVAAGVRVQSVVTPALALLSLAWTRRAAAVPGAVDAYVALEETATCLALVRDGVLVAACDIAWGYLEERKGRMQPRPRQEIAARLADELNELFRAAGSPAAQVCICGGLHDLRSTTVPLMERLDIEVETLDALFAIDAARLPEPVDEFRDRVSELRLAWAVAADDRAPINLLRHEQQRGVTTALSRAAAVAGLAAGLGGAWEIGRSPWWRPPVVVPKIVARSTALEATPVTAPAAARPVPVMTPRVAVNTPPAGQPAPVPLVQPQTTLRPVAAVSSARVERPERPRSPEVRRPQVASTRQRPDPNPAALEAVVGTILYGPDRKLAIVDGRIVQLGDEVRGALVVDITPTAVLLLDTAGQSRRLTLSGSIQ